MGVVFGVKAKEFYLALIKFQSIQRHPSPYICDACLQSGNSLSAVKVIFRAVTCQVELCVISIEVKVGGVGPDNVANGSGVDAKKYGPQDRALGHTTGEGFGVQWGARYGYMLDSAGQAGFKPCEGGS